MTNPIEKAATQGKVRLERARASSGLVDITVRVFKRFSETDGGAYAAALTYFTFFSIFPLLAVGAAILGFATNGDAQLQKDIFDRAVDSYPMLKDALSPDGFKTIERARQELALIGGLLALYSGSGAIVALEHALNKVNRVEEEPNFLIQRFRSLKWLGILGVTALFSVAASAVATWAGSAIDGAPGNGLAALLRVFAVVLSTAVFATAYKFLPDKAQSWRAVLPGAIVAAVAFEILKWVGSAFIAGGEDSRNATFGAFAAAATLLVVCYLASRITLLAAEVNAVLAERRITRQPAVNENREEQ